MKLIISLFFLIVTLPCMAQDKEDSSKTIPIELNIKRTTNEQTPIIQRMPMHINIFAEYNYGTRSFEIRSSNESEGEVFLYLNKDIIGYDSQINTIIPIPELTGLYQIQIVADSWEAYGNITL